MRVIAVTAAQPFTRAESEICRLMPPSGAIAPKLQNESSMNTMKTSYTSLFTSACIACGLMATGQLFAAEISSTDKSFIKGAYEGGLTEVQMGEMGLRKTTNPEIKAYSERLIKEHATTNRELKSLADSKQVEVPANPGYMDMGKMKMLDTKSGADFDKAFVDGMVTDHQKDIKAFEKAATEGKDPDVKAFANKMLPTLKKHLTEAEAVQQKLGK